jgi:hypothetical protein
VSPLFILIQWIFDKAYEKLALRNAFLRDSAALIMVSQKGRGAGSP